MRLDSEVLAKPPIEGLNGGLVIVCWEFHSYGFTNEVDRQNISLEVQPPTTEVPLGAILETEKCSAGERNM